MPVSLSYPGVYIEEVPGGARTVTGVATSITAFVGRALRGPVNDPILINSFADFERRFGGLWVESSMSYAVRDYYLNGGSQAVVVRLYRGESGANARPAFASLPVGELTLAAAYPGAWGNQLRARVDQWSRSAEVVARFLADHPAVESVAYPGLPGHPGHELARRDLRLVDEGSEAEPVNRYGSLLSFVVRGGGTAARRAFDALDLVWRATDLGRIKSVATIPCISTHQQQGDAGADGADERSSFGWLSVSGTDSRATCAFRLASCPSIVLRTDARFSTNAPPTIFASDSVVGRSTSSATYRSRSASSVRGTSRCVDQPASGSTGGGSASRYRPSQPAPVAFAGLAVDQMSVPRKCDRLEFW